MINKIDLLRLLMDKNYEEVKLYYIRYTAIIGFQYFLFSALMQDYSNISYLSKFNFNIHVLISFFGLTVSLVGYFILVKSKSYNRAYQKDIEHCIKKFDLGDYFSHIIEGQPGFEDYTKRIFTNPSVTQWLEFLVFLLVLFWLYITFDLALSF